MQQCKHYSHDERCRQECKTFVDKDSPTRKVLIDTGRKGWNGEPELSYHIIHESHYVNSGLCFYHEQIRLGIID